MGINLVLLRSLARVRDERQRPFQPLVVYGGVPLFSYLAHLFLYAAIGNLLNPEGTSLLTMYLYWLLGLLALYPLCLADGRLKRCQLLNSPLHLF